MIVGRVGGVHGGVKDGSGQGGVAARLAKAFAAVVSIQDSHLATRVRQKLLKHARRLIAARGRTHHNVKVWVTVTGTVPFIFLDFSRAAVPKARPLPLREEMAPKAAAKGGAASASPPKKGKDSGGKGSSGKKGGKGSSGKKADGAAAEEPDTDTSNTSSVDLEPEQPTNLSFLEKLEAAEKRDATTVKAA